MHPHTATVLRKHDHAHGCGSAAIAATLAGGDANVAERELDRYRARVAERFDRVLERVSIDGTT